MQQIPDKIDSKFRFVLLAARRAEQIMRGAQPKAAKPSNKPTSTGMQEIMEEAVGWDYGPEEVEDALVDGSDDGAEAAAEPEAPQGTQA